MGRTTREESERAVRAILAATTIELAEHGYAGLRVPAVAERVGKTYGAVYGRFDDKESLVLAALRQLRDDVVAPKVAASLARNQGFIAQLEGLSGAVAEIAEEHPQGQRMFARLAVEMAAAPGPLGDEVRALFASFAELLRDLIARGQACGEIATDVDAQTLAHAVVGLPVAFMTMTAMFGKTANYADLEATLSRVLSRGLAGAERRPPTQR